MGNNGNRPALFGGAVLGVVEGNLDAVLLVGRGSADKAEFVISCCLVNEYVS